jgi:predicted Zn-dependent protease
MNISRLAAAFIACAWLTGIPAKAELPDLGDVSRVAFSEQEEAQVGREIMRSIRNSPGWIDAPEINDYLSRLVDRLVRASDEPHRHFEVFLVRDTTINAFALPGGFLGVHTGLIAAARSEDELAGVLAHEIAHVTQHHIARMVQSTSGDSLAMLAALAIAVLAANSHPEVSNAALTTAQASVMQGQINFTRLHEREADRVGLQILTRAGFDPAGIASFFERMMAQGRLYEIEAPIYLRTHPLSHERMADLQNRIQSDLRLRPKSDEFAWMQAAVMSLDGNAVQASKAFKSRVQASPGEPALHYGLALAALRNHDVEQAQTALAHLRAQTQLSEFLQARQAMLAARIAEQSGGAAAALPALQKAQARLPGDQPLAYLLAEILLRANQPELARRLIETRLSTWPEDARLYRQLAQAELALGKRLQSHMAQAEAYRLEGLLEAALEQLQIGLRTGQGDFYTLSIADSRIKALRDQLRDTATKKKH